MGSETWNSERPTDQPTTLPTDRLTCFFRLVPSSIHNIVWKRLKDWRKLFPHSPSQIPPSSHPAYVLSHLMYGLSELPCLLDLVDTKFLNYGYPGVPLHRWTKYSIKQLHSCKCPRVMSRGRPTTPAKVNHWINFCPAITKLFQLHRTSLSVWSV